ncbi:MAG: ABC transporter substrate-binding protein [Candidatus Levyibacteriota bacterium]
MAFVRRRYYLWLLKAYIKRWKKTIFASLIIGAAVFFVLFLSFSYYVLPLLNRDIVIIGYVGTYNMQSMPEEILQDVSYGLTADGNNDKIIPAAAAGWTISPDNRTYTFTIKKGLTLSNGKKFTADEIPYTFSDVQKKVLSAEKIEFKLKNPYSPFLAVVSKPIIIKNYGLKDYYLSKIEENSGFIKSLTLSQIHSNHRKIYYFYPTQDALVTAFQLGEVNEIHGVSYATQPEKIFGGWKNVGVNKHVDEGKLVAIFFNTLDQTMSNKKVRQALLYALPDSFEQGQRTYSFIPQDSMYYTKSPNEGLVDLDLSKSLLKASGIDKTSLTIYASPDLFPVAQKVAKSWKKINIDAKITQTNDIPVNYSVFIYSMNLPKDPDMYSLWHSDQQNNIMHYKNVRIDKLLEEGRQTVDEQKRVQIYADVQKYLLDDSPTAFLYFPYSYTVVRK